MTNRILMLLLLVLLIPAACSDDDSATIDLQILYGNWVETPTPHPGSTVMRFFTNEQFTEYSDYSMNIVDSTGSWSLAGSTLTLSNDGIEIPFSAKVYNTNHFSLSFAMLSVVQHYYRVGSVPFASQSNTAAQLTVGASYVSNYVASGSSKWFYFEATAGKSYTVNVDDVDGSGTYDGDVMLTISLSDMTTLFGTQLDEDLYNSSAPVNSVPASGRIYLIVDANISLDDSGNPFAIKVQEAL